MQAMDYRCPSCSAPLMFNPEKGFWKCDYCSGEFTLEELEKTEKKFGNLEQGPTMDVDEYSCSSCGAKIIADETTTATFCVYCGNTSIIKNRLTGVLKPKYVIPFKNTKEDAVKAFLKFKKGKPFAPKEFGQKEQIEKLTGVYIPFWLYDAEASGEVDGVGTKVKTWRSGDYRYTKTDTYRVRRGGNAKFVRVPVDGATKFDDNTMDSIEPFDYDGIKEFAPGYLSGFLAEKYDVDSEEAYKRAELRIENALEDYFKRDIRGYSSVLINSKNIDEKILNSEYVLFPVWMLNIKYKDKMHMFAMNGQTGKMVGNVPISPAKLIAWLFGLLSGITLILFLILYFVL